MKVRLSLVAAGIAAAVLALPAQAQFTERTIRLSNGVNQEHPVGNGVAKMNACVGEKSGGKMKIQGFWGGALGGDLQATQSLRSGTQEMVITSTSPLIGILPDLGVFDRPPSLCASYWTGWPPTEEVTDGSWTLTGDRAFSDQDGSIRLAEPALPTDADETSLRWRYAPAEPEWDLITVPPTASVRA